MRAQQALPYGIPYAPTAHRSHAHIQDYQNWAVKYCAKNGLNVFYDGLNPLAGLGGGAPGDRVEQGELPQSTLANNTAGLLKPDWTSPWLDKLGLEGCCGT